LRSAAFCENLEIMNAPDNAA